MEKKEITLDEFFEIQKKFEITYGTITAAERIPKSKKMLKLVVDFGLETRIVATNLGEQLEPEVLVGKQLPFITNLAPATIMGVESRAMIMPGVKFDGSLELENLSNGTKIL